MFHACFIHIATCFTTSYHYYKFSGTNQLTRCHNASLCLFCLCIAEKVQNKNAQKIQKKIHKFYFARRLHGLEGQVRWRPEASLPGLDAALMGGGAEGWCGLLVHPLVLPFSLFIASMVKTLKRSTILSNTTLCSATIQNPNSGDKSLCAGTLLGRGSALGAICIAIAASRDKEGVVLHRG